MKNSKKLLLLFFLLINCTLIIDNSPAQWIKQLSPQHFITDIEFINRYTGWACGNNQIYKTTDSGKNWINQPNPSTFLIMQIHPVNDSVVYAAGWWNFLKTTDGGQNWISIFAGGPGQGLPTLDGLYFINENTGWLCGNVVVMKTTDGGNTFIDSGRIEGIPTDIYFKNESEGIMSSEVATVFKTTDGGQTWIRNRLITKGSQYDFNRISFINDSVGYVGGEIVFKTHDFGWTWDSVGAVPYGFEQAYCIEFADENTGYSGGTTGTLFKSTDGGQSWRHEQVAQFGTGFYRDIFAYSDSIVWAAGNGKILFTETGGQVNVQQISTQVPDDFILFQNYPNPFNPTTNVRFQIPNSGFVSLKVFDITGREAAALINKHLQAGEYNFQFSNDNYQLGSGVYFYTLSQGEKRQTRKFILLK